MTPVDFTPIVIERDAADALLDARAELTDLQYSTLPGTALYEAMARAVRGVDDGLTVLAEQACRGSAARGATASAVPSGQSTPASDSTASARPAGGPLPQRCANCGAGQGEPCGAAMDNDCNCWPEPRR